MKSEDKLYYKCSHLKKETQRIYQLLLQKARSQPSLTPLTDKEIFAFIEENVSVCNVPKKTKQEVSNWEGFLCFYVERKVEEAEDICSFYLRAQDNRILPSFTPGQYLTFRFTLPKHSRHRCYSLSSSPNPYYYRISVKRECKNNIPGLVSTYLHDCILEGDILELKMPGGKFCLSMKTLRPIVLVAGGIGVTPLLSILHTIVASSSTQEVWLFYQIRDGKRHGFKEELERVTLHSNVHIVVSYSRPQEVDVEGRDYQHLGRISIKTLQQMLPSFDCDYYICGPGSMMESIVAGLKQQGVAEKNIHYEAFGAASIKSKRVSATLPKKIAKKHTRKYAKPLVLWRKKQKTAVVKAPETPAFEKYLSKDAGTPGPIERLVAQSTTLLKAIQATIGLKFILLANFFDIIVEVFIGYFQGILHSWKMARAIERKWQRGVGENEIHELLEDFTLARIQLSKIFLFRGFDLHQYDSFLTPLQWQQMTTPGFPLKLIIATRYQLDQIKQDLTILTTEQTLGAAKNSLKGFLFSFFPNPLALFTAWRDFFVLAFLMRYSREEIELMYLEMLFGYRQLILALAKESQTENLPLFFVAGYEEKLAKCFSKESKNAEVDHLENYIEKSMAKIQRFLQVLCNPELFLNPYRWSYYDLLREVSKRSVAEIPHPSYSLELERRLVQCVAKALNKKGVTLSVEEIELQKHEAKRFRVRLEQSRKVQIPIRKRTQAQIPKVKNMQILKPCQVTFCKSQKALLYKADSTYTTLLDLAEENGIAIDFGCRSGSCGVCKTVLKSGSIAYLKEVWNEELEENECLPCVAVPRTDVSLDA